MTREEIIIELFENMGKLKRAFVPAHGEPKGMPTRAQFGILVTIAHDGPQGIKELGGKLCMTSSAATQLVNALVKEKLVKRAEEQGDRRKTRITLTDTGKQQLQRAKKHRLKSMAKLLEPLSTAELTLLRKLQRKIFAPYDA